MTNRLADAPSPYLRQHGDNPVHWWPWCEAAFDEARTRDVPVLLSIGYAACHWCHVMAHESFSDPETAAVMNERFVSIKVDREERPDVDAVYMTATQAMTGRGGWPLTAFLTPEGQPFYCGTYFPKQSHHGIPSFMQILDGVSETWRTNRGEVARVSTGVANELASVAAARIGVTGSGEPLDSGVLDLAVGKLRAEFDTTYGGFGGAPKFPMAMVLEFLLRHHGSTRSRESLAMAAFTAERMARGGIFDQLAGGFARYSVDARWVVPHFEKMLYDNALLLRAYLLLWRATGSPTALRVTLRTSRFLINDLGTPQGGFASALDADADGQEGLTYVWTPAQLVEVLGAEDGIWAADLYRVTETGTFEHGTSTLQLPADPDDAARGRSVRERLAARAARPQPERGESVVTAWNGLAIAALADAGILLNLPNLVEAAQRAAGLLLTSHLVDGRLRRTSRDGVAGPAAGVLEDYGDLAEGLLALAQATGQVRWLTAAGDLLETALLHFGDGRGGWYDTADDAESLVFRPADPTDNAAPSGASAMAGALLTYSAMTGSVRHRIAAEDTLSQLTPLVAKHSRFAGWAAAVGMAWLAGPAEVAIVGEEEDPARHELERAARMSGSPGAVVCVGTPDAGADRLPLLADRALVDDQAAAYVCRGFVCNAPVTTPDDLAALLAAAARR